MYKENHVLRAHFNSFCVILLDIVSSRQNDLPLAHAAAGILVFELKGNRRCAAESPFRPSGSMVLSRESPRCFVHFWWMVTQLSILCNSQSNAACPFGCANGYCSCGSGYYCDTRVATAGSFQGECRNISKHRG